MAGTNQNLGVDLDGFDRLRQVLDRAPNNALRALAGALYAEANATLTASKLEVPVDKGVLRGSAHVAPPIVAGQTVTVEMGYGGAASEYAEIQHERTDFQHRVGKAKFLVDPFMARAGGMGSRLRAAIGDRIFR